MTSEKSEWPLTEEERSRLAPLIEETDVSIRVTTGYILLDESCLAQAGLAVGWWPRSERRVLLLAECFETASDEQLLGILARALGHYEGYHRLLGTWLRRCLIGVVLAVSMAGYWVLAPAWDLGGPVGIGLFAVVGAVSLLVIETVGLPAFGRWASTDATRRGALLLGETDPLEALYEPRVDEPRHSWYGDLVTSAPHPQTHLETLAALDDDLNDEIVEQR